MLSYLASRFIPSGVVRENRAPNVYIPLSSRIISYMPSRGSSWFLYDLPPVSLILCFRRSTEVSTYLSYHSLFHHKSFLLFFHNSFFRRAQTSWARSSSFSPWRAASWLRISYEEITSLRHSSFFHSSFVIFKLRYRIIASAPILYNVRPNVSLSR